jgi:hypothetical protein
MYQHYYFAISDTVVQAVLKTQAFEAKNNRLNQWRGWGWGWGRGE